MRGRSAGAPEAVEPVYLRAPDAERWLERDRLRRVTGAEGLTIRKLSYCDLPSVIAIERRSFPTPWSLAMFVLELSKPQGICLAAEDEHGLVGYLVCARYDRVWHLMNVAIAPEHRRRGIATRR